MPFRSFRLFLRKAPLAVKLWIRKELKKYYTLSVQLALFSSYPLREWAENKTREQSTASQRPEGHIS